MELGQCQCTERQTDIQREVDRQTAREIGGWTQSHGQTQLEDKQADKICFQACEMHFGI